MKGEGGVLRGLFVRALDLVSFGVVDCTAQGPTSRQHAW